MKLKFYTLLCFILMLAVFHQQASAWPRDYSRDKTKWYIGFGIGGGATWMSRAEKGNWPGSLIFSFKVGGLITQRILLGFEMYLSLFDMAAIGIGARIVHRITGETIKSAPGPRSFFGVMATYFPFDAYGFLVKSGLGLGLNARFDDPATTRVGLDWRAGLGYEFQIFTSFVLGVEVINGLGLYFPMIADEILFQMTFSWY
jgi:hypothetical protein